MADAIISMVAESVGAIIADHIRYELYLVRGMKEKLQDVSSTFMMIKDVLDDAEKKGVVEQSVKRWLRKLEDTAYEMHDILDEWNYTLLKHNIDLASKQTVYCCSFIPSPSLCYNKVANLRKTGKKIETVKTTLSSIFKEKDDFKFEASNNYVPPLIGQSTPGIDLTKVHGMDIHRNKNDIVMKLGYINGDSLLCIVGMGGLGKTTLAQLVYNHTQVEGCFDVRIWICVSKTLGIEGIARDIVHSVGEHTIPLETKQLGFVLEKLKLSVSGKKFFLVLDDVWSEDPNHWKDLKTNLLGEPGSKILVTTRSERAAKAMGALEHQIYHPQELTSEESWTVLRSISFPERDENEHGKFKEIGLRIAKVCYGWPLAVSVMGSLLLFKNRLEDWEGVFRSGIWSWKTEEKLFPHLRLSYNELSPALKRCFSYCAIYPKDSQINVESLIEGWMALGYLGSASGNGGIELKGRDYFNVLAMRSLFKEFKRKDGDDGDVIVSFKMHDIVHDFVQYIRKNDDVQDSPAQIVKSSTCQVCDPLIVSQVKAYRSLFYDKETPPNICDCLASVRVLSFQVGMNGSPQGMKKLKHLRWLKLSGTSLSKDDLKMICRLVFLQTLLLGSCSLEEIPQEIGNLIHLRHLDLSENKEIKELAGSMCHLLELQILNIKGCYGLHELPEWIHSLQNLQHLLSDATIHLPQGVGQLSGLRTLSEFAAGSGWNKLHLLKGLTHLSGSLLLQIHLSSTTDLKELAQDARQAQLRNKTRIHALKVEFEKDANEPPSSSSASSLWVDVMEALEPSHELKRLEIWGYAGPSLPQWLSSPLNLLKEVHLVDSSEMSSLPSMGKLPFLEVVEIRQLEELKSVGREFLGMVSANDVIAYPRLKKMEVHVCNQWEEWEDITREEEESAAVSIMPCLTLLRIFLCGALKKLPHRLLRKASSLQILNIQHSSELQRSYADKDGSLWRSISCNNPQLRLLHTS